jgi:hypothetical protein
MHYNKTMSEDNLELNPDLDGIDPNGFDTVCCNGCTCAEPHSSTPRPE